MTTPYPRRMMTVSAALLVTGAAAWGQAEPPAPADRPGDRPVPTTRMMRRGRAGQERAAEPPGQGVLATSQPTTRSVVRRERTRLGPPQPTRLRLDIFTVTLTTEKGIEFSLDALPAGAADDPKALLAALGRLGEAAMPYRFDEPTDLAAEMELTSGQRVPVVQNVTAAHGGTVVPSVSYQKVGCIVRVSGLWKADGGARPAADVRLDFHMTDVNSSGVEVSEKVRLPVFAELSIDRDLRAESGRPILFAALTPQKSKEHKVVGYTACVVRLQLDRIEP